MPFIGNQPSQIAFLTDSFNGNGSTTAFTMSVAPANPASVLVVVSGVVQDPSTYSTVGNTLTFSGAPPTGTGNISARYLGIPASGVTTTAYRTVTEFTATAGQTTFTPPSYTVGFIDVLRNGVRLGSADYTATNGTTVVLAGGGVTSGDLITTVSFFVSSVLNAIPATAGSVGSTYLASSLSLTSPTLTSASFVTPASSIITSGTSVATTSGTSVVIATGLPTWVKRISVILNGVGTNGTVGYLVQLGPSGSYTSTGYSGGGTRIGSGTGNPASSTAGFLINSGASGGAKNMILTIDLVNTSFGYICSGTGYSASENNFYGTGGSVTLSAALAQVQITTTNGTDAFNAGSINILYE